MLCSQAKIEGRLPLAANAPGDPIARRDIVHDRIADNVVECFSGADVEAWLAHHYRKFLPVDHIGCCPGSSIGSSVPITEAAFLVNAEGVAGTGVFISRRCS